MAEKLNGQTDLEGGNGPGVEHNSEARAEIITSCAKDMRDINQQRSVLNERAGKVRKRLDDAGIDKKSFLAALRIADMEDDAGRDTYIDGLRESMRVLGVGAQGDMFPAAAAA